MWNGRLMQGARFVFLFSRLFLLFLQGKGHYE